jgi:hypothetical protein
MILFPPNVNRRGCFSFIDIRLSDPHRNFSPRHLPRPALGNDAIIINFHTIGFSRPPDTETRFRSQAGS